MATAAAVSLVLVASCAATREPAGDTRSGPVDGPLTSSPQPSRSGAWSTDSLDAFGRELLSESGATGGIVAVRVADEEPLVVGFGQEASAAGVEGARIDATAPLDVASVTKSYVAALALVLAADGVVDLDTPIARWVSWPGGERITLRNLLTHTSGVGRFGDGENPSRYWDLVARGEPVSTVEALDLARGVDPVAEPGGATRYANLNYLLAGAVVEAAAGTSLHRLLRERILEPAGLEGTWYPPDHPARRQPPVGLFEVDAGLEPILSSDVPLDAWRTATGAASGAIATVDDLLSWSEVVFRRQELEGVDLSAMTRIGPGGYGLGVIGIAPDGDCVFDGCPPGVRFGRWALNGDFPGSSTRVVHDPGTDTTVVVFLNRNALELDPALDALLDRR